MKLIKDRYNDFEGKELATISLQNKGWEIDLYVRHVPGGSIWVDETKIELDYWGDDYEEDL